jgi:hypothetical protein
MAELIWVYWEGGAEDNMFSKLVKTINRTLFPGRFKKGKSCNDGFWWAMAAGLLESQLLKNAMAAKSGKKIDSKSQQLGLGQIVGAGMAAANAGAVQGGEGGVDTGIQDTGMDAAGGAAAPTWSPYSDSGNLISGNGEAMAQSANVAAGVVPSSFSNQANQTPTSVSTAPNPSAVAMEQFQKQQQQGSPDAQFNNSRTPIVPTNVPTPIPPPNVPQEPSRGSFLGGLKKGGLGMPQGYEVNPATGKMESNADADTSPWFYAGALIPSILRAKLGVDTTMEAGQRNKVGGYYEAATSQGSSGTSDEIAKKNRIFAEIMKNRKPGQKVFMDDATGMITYQ